MALGSSDPSLITNCVNAYVLFALKQFRPCGLRGVDCILFRRRSHASLGLVPASLLFIPFPRQEGRDGTSCL